MSFTLLHRFAAPASTLPAVLALAEQTSDYVWVGVKGRRRDGAQRAQRLRRYTLRGVPARQLDLVLCDSPPPEGVPLAVEIGQKAGRFDGQRRTQLVLRHWMGGPSQPLAMGRLRIEIEDDCPPEILAGWEARECGPPPEARWAVVSAVWQARTVILPPTPGREGKYEPKPERQIELTGGGWLEAYPMLRSDLTDYNLPRIVMWQWTRYYSVCVERADAEQIAEVFAAMPEVRSMTLAEANRLASRILYDAARRAGWRKLTLREARLYRLDAGGWVHQEKLDRLRAEMGLPVRNPAGVGDYTQQAAHGNNGYIQTAYGAISED